MFNVKSKWLFFERCCLLFQDHDLDTLCSKLGAFLPPLKFCRSPLVVQSGVVFSWDLSAASLTDRPLPFSLWQQCQPTRPTRAVEIIFLSSQLFLSSSKSIAVTTHVRGYVENITRVDKPFLWTPDHDQDGGGHSLSPLKSTESYNESSCALRMFTIASTLDNQKIYLISGI